MNNVNCYLSELEKEFGKNKTPNGCDFNRKKYFCPSFTEMLADNYVKSDYKWTLKNRLKHTIRCAIDRFKFLSPYDPFDFKTYEEEYNPYGFDSIYTKFKKTSTPKLRFKRFWGEFLTSLKMTKESFLFTPSTIKHFKQNKKRISFFEQNMKNLFFRETSSKIKKDLKELGYTFDNDGRIYFK